LIPAFWRPEAVLRSKVGHIKEWLKID